MTTLQPTITDFAKSRHTAKGYDDAKRISDADLDAVKELLRYAPSSVNSQPWHFIIAGSEEGKARVAKATEGTFVFNKQAVLDASHVVVFCGQTSLDEAYLEGVLEQEDRDGRFDVAGASKEKMRSGRNGFVKLHQETIGDGPAWISNQVYLNLGSFLLGVSALGLDATPMEGFDPEVLDAEFDLKSKGLRSLVIVPIGYHDDAKDYNASLPKSRLPVSEIVTEV